MPSRQAGTAGEFMPAGSVVEWTDRQAATPLEVFRQSSWMQRFFLALAIAAPILVAGLFAVLQHGEAMSEARDNARRSVVALEQHAANVLDTHSLILRQLDILTHGQRWEQIKNDELLRLFLSDFSRDLSQVSAIGITDAEGNVITSSRTPSTDPVSIASRDIFLAHKNRSPAGIFVSEAFSGRAAGERHFALSIRRRLPSGEFGGVIFTAVPLEHFISFWKGFTPADGYLVPMVRPDGALIVRYPRSDSPQHLDPRGPFVTHLTQSPNGLYTAISQVDNIERINAYRQVKNYPLFISFSVETATVLADWRTQVLVVAIMAAVAAALLVALWIAVVRHSLDQRLSGQRWETAARALQDQVALRRQAEESARLDAERASFGEQLIGIVSHDLRNPLNTITLSAAVMARRGALVPQDAQMVQRIQNAAGRAVRLIGDLLDFTQARLGGRIPVQPRRVDLHELLTTVLAELEAANPGRIALSLEADAASCDADPDRLAQVVENLVTNALKYGSPGGVVRVNASSDEHWLTVEVRNDGAPIPEEKLATIFEPLQRGAHQGRFDADRSIGMGLFIVKHLVDAHSGTLSVRSSAADGTTFTVRIPRP